MEAQKKSLQKSSGNKTPEKLPMQDAGQNNCDSPEKFGPSSSLGQQKSTSFMDDPTSFVVLPTPDSFMNHQGALPLKGPRSMAEMQASLSQSDMSLDDAVMRCWELMKENRELKDTVRGHTALMKKQFQTMSDLKEKWIAEQDEVKARHAEAKFVVTNLKSSLEEKDKIIEELQHHLKHQSSSNAPLENGISLQQQEQRKLVDVENENRLLLNSKLELSQKIQELTDEVFELREKLKCADQDEQVVVNLERESASIQAHLLSLETHKDGAEQKNLVLQEEVSHHMKTIEILNAELSESQNIKKDIECEYIKLTEEHNMLKDALQEDKEMMKETNLSLKKIQDSYEKLLKEKTELLALNNQMVLQLQSLKGSPLSELSVEQMLGSGSTDESCTSEVIFHKGKYMEQLEKQKRLEAAITAGRAAGDMSSPIEGFTTVSLTEESLDTFVKRQREVVANDTATNLKTELTNAEHLPGTSPKRKSREDRAISDLLLQLQDERSKVAELRTTKNEMEQKVNELEEELSNNNKKLAQTSRSVSQLNRESQQQKEGLLNRISLLQEELAKLQEVQDEPLKSISEVHMMEQQVQHLISDRDEANRRHAEAEKRAETFQLKCTEMQRDLKKSRNETEMERIKDDQLIEAMRKTIFSMEENIRSDRTELERKNHHIEELQSNYKQLFNDYHHMLHNNEEEKKSKVHKDELAKLHKEYQTHVDSLTAKLITTEQMLAAEKRDMHHMQTSWQRIQEVEPVLKAQAEVFKADFEAERKAREDLANEREALLMELDQTRRRNQQLKEELTALQANQVSELQRRHGYMSYPQQQASLCAMHAMERHQMPSGYGTAARMAPPDILGGGANDSIIGEYRDRDYSQFDMQRKLAASARQSEEEEHKIFKCPKCDLQCPDYDTLTLHVNECLDQD